MTPYIPPQHPSSLSIYSSRSIYQSVGASAAAASAVGAGVASLPSAGCRADEAGQSRDGQSARTCKGSRQLEQLDRAGGEARRGRAPHVCISPSCSPHARTPSTTPQASRLTPHSPHTRHTALCPTRPHCPTSFPPKLLRIAVGGVEARAEG